MTSIHEKKIIEWKTNKKLTKTFNINFEKWLMKTKMMRIFSTFLILTSLSKIAKLMFLKREMINYEWKQMISNMLYKFQRTKSSYEKKMKIICEHRFCFKLSIINWFINKMWKSNESIIFCTMKSINSLILYWMNDVRKKISKNVIKIIN